MAKLMKQTILPFVHEVLRRRYGQLTLLSGQGVTTGERVEFELDGNRVRCVIKVSSGGRISFGKSEGKWSGLDACDFVAMVAPTSLDDDDHIISFFDQRTMKLVFDANQAAQDEAGMGHLPNWVAPFHEEGRGPRGVGDGFGDKALWSEPLIMASTPAPRLGASATRTVRALTIAEAKQGLAMTFGVDPDAIEITIRG
ncbi:hypothetical protein [Bradyrhizobium sp. SRS-191]|uniref:hypothetical protein n=1 Tax=Bradyrhizobium sp. SRS-191 TaxID=2962606 RepID=UPI00211F0082|nr:hypothetical protein [Bradyrhizobium sp. SRS-191]